MVFTPGNLLMVAHHEGLEPHPEEARGAISKDEATALENALVLHTRDRRRDVVHDA